jgi:tRNA threonylcarbamoyladenosine biosynthesis protein TsaB
VSRSAVLGLDTATPATVVGVVPAGGAGVELRHDPEPGERPQHAARLLPLAHEALDRAGLGWADVGRIGAGVGPGTFTGLRIGVATARALAQATGARVAAVSTLEALATGAVAGAGLDPAAVDAGEPTAADPEPHGVLAVLDARRGEAFAAAWLGGERVLAPTALTPDDLAAAAGALARRGASPWLAVGDGAVRFRPQLESEAVSVPADGSPLHLVSALEVCRLAVTAPAVPPQALVPEYVRVPDADLAASRPRG